MNLFSRLSGRRNAYNVWKLVNRRVFASETDLGQPVQVISDIDKTYLETAFDTIGEIAKIAIETADEKKTVDGARNFLRQLKWGKAKSGSDFRPKVPLHFVSSSPPQLRAVLEEKISMDALSWSSDSFKDQVYNLRLGKISLLKHQVSYKMASILSLCTKFTRAKQILLIGDNAETDPFIYLLVKKVLEQTIDKKECMSLLSFLDVSESIGKQIFEGIGELKKVDRVDIMIRQIPGKKLTIPDTYKSDLLVFEDYFQAAILAHFLGYLSVDCIEKVMISMHNFNGYDLNRASSLAEIYVEEFGDEVDRDEFLESRISQIRHLFQHILMSRDDQKFLDTLKEYRLGLKNRDDKILTSEVFRNWVADQNIV